MSQTTNLHSDTAWSTHSTSIDVVGLWELEVNLLNDVIGGDLENIIN
jgi:hypothetical protein